jgi:hypothetical protein
MTEEGGFETRPYEKGRWRSMRNLVWLRHVRMKNDGSASVESLRVCETRTYKGNGGGLCLDGAGRGP